tara:strand:+ start:3697 stop:3807 length:111 start_codon:yes stop_codon:yes gene_type:complete
MDTTAYKTIDSVTIIEKTRPIESHPNPSSEELNFEL